MLNQTECLFLPIQDESGLRCQRCGLFAPHDQSPAAILLDTYRKLIQAPHTVDNEKTTHVVREAILALTLDQNAPKSVSQHIADLFFQTKGVQGQAYRDLVVAFKEHGMIIFREKFSSYYLRSLKLDAKTIVDVGTNNGTEPLYSAFPDAKFVLIDPLQEELNECRKKYPNLNADFHCLAVGAKTGTLTIIKTSVSGHSSAMSRNSDENGKQISVEMRRLDELLSAHEYQRPYGIKIDTEGYELEVLHGLTHSLSDVEFIIAEVSIKKIFKDGYKFSDIIDFMSKNNFQLFDILNAAGHQPNHFDCLFLPANHILFSIKE